MASSTELSLENLLTECYYRMIESVCPVCEQDNSQSVTFEGDRCILRICNVCGKHWGIDDSIDLATAYDKQWKFECLDESSNEGGGDSNGNFPHQHIPVFKGFETFGENMTMHAVCLICQKTGPLTHEPSCGESEDDGYVEGNIEEESDFGEDETVNLFGDEPLPHEDVHKPIFCSYCKNREPELFETVRSADGVTIPLKCWNCEFDYNSDPWLLECRRCLNDNENFFEKNLDKFGCLETVKCLNCDLSFTIPDKLKRYESNDGNSPKSVEKERIKSWDKFSKGDHISFQRALSYEHHALIISIHQTEKRLHVIEYGSINPGSPDSISIEGKISFSVVREYDVTDVNLEDDFVYRFNYRETECFPPDEVIKRARGRLVNVVTTFSRVTVNISLPGVKLVTIRPAR